MRVLVSGSTGFIGSALIPSLQAHGHDVVRLARDRGRQPEEVPQRAGAAAARPSNSGHGSGTISWDPMAGRIDQAALEGIEAVVHLAGESIVGRWTPRKRAAIRDSRVLGTRLLCESLARLARPPAVILTASAIGYYGDRGSEPLDEDSRSGEGFLAEVCREWEGAALPAAQRGIRVAALRIGVVVSPAGGALGKMLPIFRLGLGGVIGNGRQYWSWIAIDDLIGAIEHALVTPSLTRAVNLTAPTPATNREFTRELARALKRPAVFPLPAPVARLMLGHMADELLLASARVSPSRLLATGYIFRHPELPSALRDLLSARR